MTQEDKRNKAEYIRLLELISVISEEWGEAVKEINDYNWKGNKIEHLENAVKEIDQMYSPMFELTGLIEVIVKRKKMSE